MSIREALLKRRSVYALNKVLPVSEDEVIKAIEENNPNLYSSILIR